MHHDHMLFCICVALVVSQFIFLNLIFFCNALLQSSYRENVFGGGLGWRESVTGRRGQGTKEEYCDVSK